jgi:hypothetical protein
MLAGTITDALLLASVTVSPPAGATPVRVTVTLAGLPPARIEGETDTLHGAAGLTVIVVDFVTPL